MDTGKGHIFALIEIDGSFGEGGGQILRSSLALSMVTGQQFRIEGIRSRRQKPGLLRQHLTAVQAATLVSNAEVEGATLNSTSLTFRPREVHALDHAFSIGTAGSTSLVLQTILPALLIADGPSTLTFEGGTHNQQAPPFDFIDRAFLPLVNRMGPRVGASLERHGFYPAGGGKFSVTIEPCRALQGFDLRDRGAIKKSMARAVISSLPKHIADRELRTVGEATGWTREQLTTFAVPNPVGPGNVLFIDVESEALTEVFCGFGEVGVRAEEVAKSALQSMNDYIAAGVCVGEHLADQLMLLLAIAGRGSYSTVPLTMHSTTHIELIKRFLDVSIEVRTYFERGVTVDIGTK